LEIYTNDADGGGRTRLTRNTTSDSSPSYSPSGNKIAFSGSVRGNNEIYTINAGGGGKFNVTDNGTEDYSPSWGSR
jgi:TolB protein